jgi:hypothetical protein
MAKTKYSPKAKRKISSVIREQYHAPKGSAARKRPRAQKIAIGLAKARRAGLKVPRKRS